MDRKTLLAFVIIGIIFVGWFLYMQSQTPPPQPATTKKADTTATQKEAVQDTQQVAVQQDTTKAQQPPVPADTLLYAQYDSIPVDTVTIETEKYIAKFQGRGADLVSFKFKHFFYNNGDTTEVEMVPPWTSSVLNFKFPDAGGKGFDFQKIIFTPNKMKINLNGGNRDSLVFTAPIGTQDTIEVKYEFYGDRYDFNVKLNFLGINNFDPGEYYLYGWSSGLESSEKNRKDDFNSFRAYAMWDSGLDSYNKFDQGSMYHDIEGDCQWIALKSKYFFVGISPEREAEGISIRGKKVDVNEKAGEKGITMIGIDAKMQIHPRKADLFDKYMVYIGPIDYQILKSYHNGFQETVSLGGILKPISLFILWLMRNLYKVFHNYGVVIIVFSILIKVIFYPLTSRSLKSMKKMQELQPRLKAIQEKYKQEPQKMQAEIMKLWKENKVNPMSGCLLMLPQLPIFFALFNVFRNTILLRGAEFVFWMKDLSQPDPTMILPLIMAGTMFLQQKLTVQDPKQKMLVYALPVLFFFFFKGFSTGLVLYWTMFNVLSILETLLIRKPQQQQAQVAVQTK